jgi:hypothetical protein
MPCCRTPESPTVVSHRRLSLTERALTSKNWDEVLWPTRNEQPRSTSYGDGSRRRRCDEPRSLPRPSISRPGSAKSERRSATHTSTADPRTTDPRMPTSQSPGSQATRAMNLAYDSCGVSKPPPSSCTRFGNSCANWACASSSSRSEHVFQSDLNLPGIQPRARERTEAGRSQLVARLIEDRAIGQIEGLDAHLQVLRTYREPLVG